MEDSKKVAKKLFIIIGVVILALVIVLCAAFLIKIKPSVYSEQQHENNITKLVNARYMNNDKYDFSSYRRYPLYNENDELDYYLIEFEDVGFEFISLNTIAPIALLGGFRGMYSRSGFADEIKYMVWTVGTEATAFDNAKGIYVDEKGEAVTAYNRSPYKIANVADGEKLYLLSFDNVSGSSGKMRVPAVKKDGKFVSVISNKQFSSGDELETSDCFTVNFIADAYFNL